MRLLMIAVAGAAGALCRYGLGLAVGPLGFPWVTLGINAAGSFLLGVLVAVLPAPDSTVRIVVGTGLLGAFTTFSTFSWDALTMGRADRYGSATTYVLASVGLALLAAFLGFRTGEALG